MICGVGLGLMLEGLRLKVIGRMCTFEVVGFEGARFQDVTFEGVMFECVGLKV